MESQNITAKRTPIHVSNVQKVSGLAVFLFLLITVIWTVLQTSTPEPVPASAPPTEFSSERAMAHLQVIAAEPHYSGSVGIAKVQDYLINQIKSLGLQPEIQEATAIRPLQEATFDHTGHVQNIMVRIKGTEANGKAVLLSAHYDSTPHSNGASKNGASVAQLLETMRAMQAGAPLKHDVIFLFTDGLEGFLIGSKAFVDEHPWAKDVGVVLNFDGRGSSGPVLLAETSEQNGWLVREFAQAAPNAFANSLLYQLVKMMPDKNLDATMFNESTDAAVLSFLYADDIQNYRNQNDTIEHVDEGTLQHQGSYALALVKHFGNANLENTKADDSVFFNLGALTLITYPITWVVPLTVLASVLFLATLIYGVRVKQLTVRGILLGFLLLLLTIIASAGTVTLTTTLVGMVTDIFSLVNHAELYMIAFIALTVAISVALFVWAQQKWSVQNLSAGALLWWLVLTALTSILLPEGNYLFAWPLLFSSVGLCYLIASKGQRSAKFWLWMCLLALPVLVLGSQMIYILFIMLIHDLPSALVTLIALVIGLLYPLLQAIVAVRKWIFPLASLGVGMALLVGTLLMPAYSEAAPKPNVLFYAVSLDDQKAYWETRGPEHLDHDEFLQKYLSGGAVEDYPFFPHGEKLTFFQQDAPFVPVTGASVDVVEDKTDGDVRTLRLNLKRTAKTVTMVINMTSDQPLESALLDGRPWKNQGPEPTRWETIYSGVPQSGIDLTLHLQKGQGVNIQVVDVQDGFPQELGVQRPRDMVATYFSDSSYVSKTYSF